jgi:hypothetical protein
VCKFYKVAHHKGCQDYTNCMKVSIFVDSILSLSDNGWKMGLIDTNRPKIVCLCGSTRFKKEFEEANFNETVRNGRIVLSVGCYTHADKRCLTVLDKEILDELHKRKIDLADEVLVLNVGGYIGESTKNEIEYAESQGKPIRYLESLKAEGK